MWGDMKQWLKDGGCIPDDEELATELKSPEYEVLATSKNAGKIKLESKKDMKSRGVPSPNKADGLALTFAFPVHSKKINYERNNKGAKLRTENRNDLLNR